MSALIHLLAASQRKFEKKSLVAKLTERMNQLSEPFWFVLALILFMLMGPFSVIAVIVGLYQLTVNNSSLKEPESI